MTVAPLSLLALVTLPFEITAEDIAVACAFVILIVVGAWVRKCHLTTATRNNHIAAQ
jgi:hypothetical protein